MDYKKNRNETKNILNYLYGLQMKNRNEIKNILNVLRGSLFKGVKRTSMQHSLSTVQFL
jgi:hypothetical protein